jgi:hypothetical protein
MHRLFRDALNTALQKLGFPWLTPHPTKTSHEIGYFQKSITPNDLYGMYKRNQMAHSIVSSSTSPTTRSLPGSTSPISTVVG